MSSWVFLKAFGDACLYFSVIGALPSLFVHQVSFFLPALLCGFGPAVAAMLYDRGKGELRYLGLLFPLLSLVLVRCVMDALILIPALIYCTMVTRQCDFSLDYYSFREAFMRTLSIWVPVFAVVAVFHGLESNLGAKTPILNAMEPLRYGALYAVSGVLLCRLLRIGEENRGQRNPARTALLMGGAGAAVAAFVAAERFLQNHATSLVELIIYFFTVVIGLPVHLVSLLFNWIMSMVDEGYKQIVKESSEQLENSIVAAPLPTEELTEEVAQQTEAGFPWWLAILVLAALVVLLVFLMKMFRAGGSVSHSNEVRGKVAEPERKGKQERRSNRGKVRHYYRRFLKAEKKRGAKLRPSQTSADILKAVSPDTDADTAARLREVYLSARYDETREITREQVDAAKNALKEMQG